jgi:hypothetical protein
MATKLTNINIMGDCHSINIAIGGMIDRDRYHIWLDRATLKPIDDKLYKNAAGKFGVMHLRQSRGIGVKIVPQMLAALPALAADFEEQMRVKTEQRAQANERRHSLICSALAKLTPEEIEACQLEDMQERVLESSAAS